MKEQFFQQKNLNTMVRSIERPMQDLLDLNLKTLQNMSYVTPVEFLNVLKPEQILEKNMNVLIQNSQKAMNYMLNVFQIMEHHWINIFDQIAENPSEEKSSLPIAKSTHLADSKVKKASASKASSVKSKAKPVAKKTKTSKAKPKSSNQIKAKENTQSSPSIAKQQLQASLSSSQQNVEKQGANDPGNLKKSVLLLKPETKDMGSPINKPK